MKKLFTNDTFFLVSVILSVVSLIPFSICCLLLWPQYSYMSAVMLINAASAIGLYISYKRHSKNVMKGLVGFLLMGIVSVGIMTTFPLEWDDVIYTILSLINFATVILLSINHFVINSDHHSKSSNILLNQILLFTQFALYIIMAAKWIYGLTGILLVLYMIGIPVEAFGITATIVCVESRLDAYKLDREEAGWTEEKGYPENYVHPYEK